MITRALRTEARRVYTRFTVPKRLCSTSISIPTLSTNTSISSIQIPHPVQESFPLLSPISLPPTIEVISTPSTQKVFGDEIRTPYWKSIPRWANVTEDEFLKYRWQVSSFFRFMLNYY